MTDDTTVPEWPELADSRPRWGEVACGRCGGSAFVMSWGGPTDCGMCDYGVAALDVDPAWVTV